ncbi:calpain-like cysteine protease [Planoprotostelium fungivorum]|uniref:Calpain-like cysteine protease n=1 Tax=Planoprotostelium fungivorum TaxID=1890364 RepID=A0A2P6P0L5_9EUKA|nr:calpain-like cysteine protease [Planoprotostelium fungivorum]
MKRQRMDAPVTAAELSLKVLLTTPKATVIMAVPSIGKPKIRLVNEPGKKLLSQITEASGDDSSLFWSSIKAAARGESVTESEIQISGIILAVRYRSIVVAGENLVVVKAKQSKKEASQLFLRHGPNEEITALTNAVEDDIVGRALGMSHIRLCMTHTKKEGSRYQVRYLSVNKNAALSLGVTQPHEIRGKTSAEMNQPMADIESGIQLFEKNFNTETSSASFSISLEQWPGLAFFCEFREVVPGVSLGFTIVHNRLHRPQGPQPVTSSRVAVPKRWLKNRWEEMMEDCIRHVQHNQHFASRTRLVVPEKFLQHVDNVFCYPFIDYGDKMGTFGRTAEWPTVQVDLPMAVFVFSNVPGNLQKKYFYTTLPDGRKLRRRVLWLNDIKGIYMIEYRHFEPTDSLTETDRLIGSENTEWPRLLREVHAQTNQQFTTSCDTINTHFDMAKTRTDEMDLRPQEVVSYVNHILHKWAPCEVKYRPMTHCYSTKRLCMCHPDCELYSLGTQQHKERIYTFPRVCSDKYEFLYHRENCHFAILISEVIEGKRNDWNSILVRKPQRATSMLRQQIIGTVEVRVEEIRGLKDINYVTATHEDQEFASKQIQPKSIEDQKWNESFTFNVYSHQSDVDVIAMRKKILNDKLVARARIPIPSLLDSEAKHEWFPLMQYISPKKMVKNIKREVPQMGEIRLHIQYTSATKKVEKTYKGTVLESAWTTETAGGLIINHGTWMKNPQFLLSVKEDDTVVNIKVFQPEASEEKVSFYILNYGPYWDGHPKVTQTNEEIVKIDQFLTALFGEEAEAKIELPKGKYVIIPCSENPNFHGKFFVNVWAESEDDFKLQSLPLEGKSWNAKSLEGKWDRETAGGGSITGLNWRKNPQFLLTLDENETDGDCCITLSQPDKDNSIGFYVIKYTGFGRKEIEYKNEVGKTESFRFAPSVGVYDMTLKAGSKYCIIPCTSDPVESAFTLSVYSDRKFDFREIEKKWEHISTRRYAWKDDLAAGSPNEAKFTDNPQFLLTFTSKKRTEFVVDLTVGDDSDAIGFLVAQRDNDKPKQRLTAGKVTNDNTYLKPEGYLAQMSVCAYGTVTENAAQDFHYVIIPSTFKAGVERSFRITVYSDEPTKLERLTEEGEREGRGELMRAGVAEGEVDEESSDEEEEEEEEEEEDEE